MSFTPGVSYDPEEVYDPNAELAAADVGFTGPDIETDQATVAEQVFNGLAERVPGWEAHDGNLETWLIEEFAVVAAELRSLIVNVPQAIFTTYGVEVLGLPIRSPAPAIGVAKWTAVDNRGYDVRPGAQFTLARSGDDLVGFEVLRGATIPPGETSIDGVQFRAVADGSAGNGLSGEGEVQDPLDWVQSIEVERPTAEGDDGQTGEDYLGTLSNLLRIVAFRPVLPWDFALLALQIPGVGRAVAMNGFEPTDRTWGHQRQVTLVVADRDGERLPEPVKQSVRDYLESVRELNWTIPVIDASYEPTDVRFDVTAYAEQDVDVVHDICVSAIEQLLAPRAWRLGLTSPAIEAGEVIPPPREPDEPLGQQVIRRFDLVHALKLCRGVAWVNDVTIDGEHEDKVLPAPTTLPRPGEVDGEVRPG